MAIKLETSEREQLRTALCSTRGRYLGVRASQLSGVPKSTLYYWAREAILVPDHYALQPKCWSYRDLVLLRMLSWLRERNMQPADASARVSLVRHRLDAGELPEKGIVRSDGRVFLFGSSAVDEATGVQLFESLVHLVEEFDVMMPIIEENERPSRWRGPNLVRPSEHTAISPWVLSGEPCVQRTRIPSASLFALTKERGLRTADILELYPVLNPDDVRDAVSFEQSLRHHQAAA